jgi:hypothetical protein
LRTPDLKLPKWASPSAVLLARRSLAHSGNSFQSGKINPPRNSRLRIRKSIQTIFGPIPALNMSARLTVPYPYTTIVGKDEMGTIKENMLDNVAASMKYNGLTPESSAYKKFNTETLEN